MPKAGKNTKHHLWPSRLPSFFLVKFLLMHRRPSWHFTKATVGEYLGSLKSLGSDLFLSYFHQYDYPKYKCLLSTEDVKMAIRCHSPHRIVVY